METVNLAVKYRPQKLDDVVGQQHVVAQLRGMFSKGKMPSSILLTGPTGLGKTTLARIIARYINCENPDTEKHAPCGECRNCKFDQDHPDVVEINAADSRGIDDVRTLVQQARNMPQFGKHRVFIVDEAQQLTNQAQNVILKPLEEPPKRTMWIIASMSPEKLLPAIAGRCLNLSLKPVTNDDIARRLYRIAKREGVDFKQIEGGIDVLKTIGDYANGGMRASVNLLESVLHGIDSGEEVDKKMLLQRFLATGEAQADDVACDLLVAVLKRDLTAVVQCCTRADDLRTVMYKLRFLLDFLIANSAKCAKFTPYSGKLFAKKARDVKVSLAVLIKLQAELLNVEWRLNSMSVDSRIVFISMLGDFVNNISK